MTDHIFSFLDSYKSKIRNPFIGTMISVWLIRNWIIVYAIFTFDNNKTMEWKINYIKNYFSKISFWSEFIDVIGIGLLSLLFTFLLLAVSRVMTDFYYKIVESGIIIKIDKNAIFTSTDKEKLEKRLVSLTEKIEKQNDALSKAESINELLQLKITENRDDFDVRYKTLSDTADNYKSLNNKLTDHVNKTKNVNDQFMNLFNKISPADKNTLLALHHNGNIDIRNLPENYHMDAERLLEKGLIKVNEKNSSISLTDSGITLMNIFQLNEDNPNINNNI